MAAKKSKKSLADPTTLQPFQKKPEESTTGTAEPKEDLLQVIIETPQDSRNKYAFDPEQEIFSLKKVLPAGMSFPYDFGFLPRTLAPDGDPLDVLVLMDEPAFPGCLLLARLIGVIEGEQIDGKKRIRNDRIVAVADANALGQRVPGRPAKNFRLSVDERDHSDLGAEARRGNEIDQATEPEGSLHHRKTQSRLSAQHSEAY